MFCEIMLIGNVGRDPDLRFTGAGMAVCSFSLAVSRARKVNDEWVEDTTWFKVTTWGQQAERTNSAIQKGNQVLVVADRIEASAYKDKHGEAAASLEVTARMVRRISKREAGEGGGHSRTGNEDFGGDDYGDVPNDIADILF